MVILEGLRTVRERRGRLALLLSLLIAATAASVAVPAAATASGGMLGESLTVASQGLVPGASSGVVGWGANGWGQLGNGKCCELADMPVGVEELSGVVSVAGGSAFSLGLLSDGSVWSWGDDEDGQLGNGAMETERDTPVAVSGLSSGVSAISAAVDGNHSLALLGDGTVRAWGYNGAGQLGDGSTESSDVPVTVSGLSEAAAIAAGGGFSLALLKNGTVVAWGEGEFGELGDGKTSNSDVPVAMSGLSGVVAIAAGEHTGLALLANGTVMAWGANQGGELGDGTIGGISDVPVAVSGLSGVKAIAGGGANLALLSNGTVMAWGLNGAGQLGDGSATGPRECYANAGQTSCSPTPVAVSGVTGAVGIAAGFEHSLALLGNGTVMAWGANSSGQLANGNTTGPSKCTQPGGTGACDPTPAAVGGVTGASTVAAGRYFGLAIVGEPPPPVPTVSEVEPSYGPPGGATSVTITGTSFTGATSVKFGSANAASFKVESATKITAVTPAGTGTVDVTVTTPEGTSATGASDRFSYAPTVTGVKPAAGPAAGGTSVTIAGTNFSEVSAVKFGSANAASFTVNSATSITAVSPAGIGIVNVTVTTAGGTSEAVPADDFSYGPTVTNVEANHGPPEGGNLVTITGTGFSGATAVKFGATNATTFAVNSATSINAISPPGSGPVDVTVTTPEGKSATSAADQFTYASLGCAEGHNPTVTGIQPSGGPAGTHVRLTGKGFFSVVCGDIGNSVRRIIFGAEEGTLDNEGSGEEERGVIAPPGSGTVEVRVEMQNGATNQLPPRFTYGPAEAPTVATEAASAVIGKAATLHATVNPHGQSVSDCHFEYGTSEGYGSTASCAPAPGSSPIPVAVSATVSALAPSTVYHFRVCATSSVGTRCGADRTFITSQASPPTVAKIEPTSGEESGGTAVKVTGSNLTDATAVKFGSISAGSFKVESETTITAISPPGKHEVDVTVTTPEGTSATGSGDRFRYDGPSTCTPPARESPVVTSVQPNGGPAAGGTAVTIKGQYFNTLGPCEPPSGAIAVYPVRKVMFGTVQATSFKEVSEGVVEAIAPAGTGTVDVTVETFTTSSPGPADRYTYGPPSPVVETDAASAIAGSSATVNATVNPTGTEVTECKFEYGPTTAYGASAACTPAPGAGTSPVAVSASVKGLANGTTYHFRISATNSGGTATGGDLTFTTTVPAKIHWYRNLVRIEEGRRTPYISWGAITLTTSKGGAPTECQGAAAGEVENPMRSSPGAFEETGVAYTAALDLYDCVNAECEAAGGKPEITSEGLPWPGALSEEAKHAFTLATTGIRLFLHCHLASLSPTESPGTGAYSGLEERKAIEYNAPGAATCVTGAEATLKPKEVAGTSVEKPSKTEFSEASGTLECGADGTGVTTGNLKMMGYLEAETIVVKNP